MSSLSPFDMVVIGALALGALIGMVVGLLRGSLLTLSWAGATVGTVYLYPYVQPQLNKAIQPPMLAMAVGGGAIFLVLLITLHLLSYSISDRVRGSRMRLLDRTLGLIAGILLPAAVMSAGYLYGHESLPKSWLEGSRTRPLIEQGAKWVDQMLPRDFKLPGVERPSSAGLKGLGDALPSAAQLLRPTPTGPNDNNPAYRGTDRRAQNDELERRP
ncbi:MAG: CvpA family protein [Alphaproteobacteria bacterium]|nr:CvpA family protein [Alphaproteobacteria bacterium]